ncbi:MAG: hypothetical protein EHM40_09335, partial [Chloroflexi bacterium]
MPPTVKHKSCLSQHRHLLVISIAILLLTVSLLAPLRAQASSPIIQSTSTPSAQPTPTFDPQRLEKPVIAAGSPEQLKKGSEIYWAICMSCHGDHGQGLTSEWRSAYGAEESNCWQSGCHGADYP